MIRLGILLFFLLHPAQADQNKEYWKDCPGPGCPARQEGTDAKAYKDELQERLNAIKKEERELRKEEKELKEEIQNLEKGGAGTSYY